MVIYSGNYVYSSTSDIVHYGVLGMRWGVRKARYYQKQYGRYSTGKTAEDKAKAARYQQLLTETKKRITSKSTEKLKKINTNYQKRQSSADRNYDKGERKEHSWLASQESADRAYKKANKQQYRANRLANKGKRWYKQMVRAYGDLELTMDKETIAIGKQFVDHVTTQSQLKYAHRKNRK